MSSLREAIISGVNEGADNAARAAEESARQESEVASWLKTMRLNAQQIIAGLEVLKDLPGSRFSFDKPQDSAQRDYIIIHTNVTGIPNSMTHTGFIYIDFRDISGHGFSSESIREPISKPDAFLKALASKLAAEGIVPRQPEPRAGKVRHALNH